jgi:RNA polymerase sigma-70 factor (sigma-E family)
MNEVAVPVALSEAADTRGASFEALYQREAVGMVRMAYLLVGSRQLAEEIVHDAFAELFERWERLEHPRAYLRTCVVNGSRSARRRRNRESQSLDASSAPAPAGLGADHLLDALAALPYRQRAAIVLRYYEDLSEAAIAEALGVRPGTVKSLVHRGLARLRGVIEL